MQLKQAEIVVFSPGGSTRKVGKVIASEIESYGIETNLIDLTGKPLAEDEKIAQNYKNPPNFLVIGSPVYVGKVAEPIQVFLNSLPLAASNCICIPFCTYGGVIVGYTIRDMVDLLKEKGYLIPRAMEVLSKHCLIFDSVQDKFGQKPGDQELSLVKDCVSNFIHQIKKTGNWEEIGTLSATEVYDGKQDIKVFYDSPSWMIPEPRFQDHKCRSDGACVETCSIASIELDENKKAYRAHGCVKCYSCMKACPTKAWNAPIVSMFPKFHEKQAKSQDDENLTRIYLPDLE